MIVIHATVVVQIAHRDVKPPITMLKSPACFIILAVIRSRVIPVKVSIETCVTVQALIFVKKPTFQC